MSDNQDKVIFTPDVKEEGKIDELPINPADISMPADNKELTEEELEKFKGELEDHLKAIEAEDLDVKNYLKVNPTFYVKGVDSENEDEELYKILNPETSEVETRELTDDEKKELFTLQLKESRKVFKPVKHNGNKTTNQFGSGYKQKRKRKNAQTKKSRKANR